MGSNVNTYEQGRDVIDVTLVADTNSYADGDVLAIPQEITGIFTADRNVRKLMSLVVQDDDDQGTAIDLVFFNATATLGTINAAVSISDADADKILGVVSIAAADFNDHINSQQATKTGLELLLKAADGVSSLWIAAIVRSGTPTYSASGLSLKLGFE